LQANPIGYFPGDHEKRVWKKYLQHLNSLAMSFKEELLALMCCQKTHRSLFVIDAPQIRQSGITTKEPTKLTA